MRARHRIIAIALIALAVGLPGWIIFQALAAEQPVENKQELEGPNPLALFAELLRGATNSYRFLDFEWDPHDCDGYLPEYGAQLNEMRTLGPGGFHDCSQLARMWLYQMAVEVPLRVDPNSRIQPPDYVLVDVLTYDPAGQVVDSLRNLVFQRADGPRNSRDIWYRSDVRRPLVITHGFDARRDCPDVMTIRLVEGGDFDVVISDSRPKTPLKELLRPTTNTPARAPTSIFGDLSCRLTHETAREIWDSLDMLRRLPPGAFERLAPEIINLMGTARPGLLRLKATEVLCEKGNDRVAELVASDMNECVERSSKTSGAYPAPSSYYHDVHRVQMFVASDLSLWNPAFRSSPAIRSFLIRLATWPDSTIHYTEAATAIETLLELLPSDGARREMLMDVIKRGGMGGRTAAYRIVPLIDKTTLASLREIIARSERTWYVVEILADAGDVETLPILQRMREKTVYPGDRCLIGSLDEAIQKIELQNPPANLIEYLKQDVDVARQWLWALRRAVALKLDKEILRAAILESAKVSRPELMVYYRKFALENGVSRPGDLANAGPDYSHLLGGGCGEGPIRRKGRVVFPGSVGMKTSWSAGDDDIKAFSEWFESQQFEDMPKDRADSLLREGLCKHHLFPMRFCN